MSYSRRMHEDKLNFRSTTLPDPLDDVNRTTKFKEVSSDLWPDIKLSDVHKYIFEASVEYEYDKEFKNEVKNILAHTCSLTHVSILTCEVTRNETALPWLSAENNGRILNSHCSCLNSSEGICSHIESLLWAIIAKREGKHKEKRTLLVKKVGLLALKTALISVATIGGVGLVVPALGFNAGGLAAGSIASAYQSSFLGGYIASGSLFSILQSVGAGGLAASTKAAIVSASAGVVTAISRIKNEKEEKQLKEGATAISNKDNEKERKAEIKSKL